MFSTFYHELTKKTVVAFGTLFNNIFIERRDSNGQEQQKIKIPLTYAAKEKFMQRLSINLNDPSAYAAQIILPAMSFQMVNIVYDKERKKNSIQKRYAQDLEITDDIVINYHYSDVPYNINFQLSLYSRNIDDGLQIMEQILPFFTPEFTITIKPKVLKDEYEKIDVPIVLNEVKYTELFEGELVKENTRFLTWDFVFTAKTYMYGPVRQTGLIKNIDINIFDKFPEDYE
jgi:hypothetical protein